MYLNKYFLFPSDLVPSKSRKKMESARKRKGSKTNLTTGKKSSKYRKVKFNDNLNPDALSNHEISLEPMQDQSNFRPLQNEFPNVITHSEITVQTYPVSSVDNSVQCTLSQITNSETVETTIVNPHKIQQQNADTQYSWNDYIPQNEIKSFKAGEKLLQALQNNGIFSHFTLILEEHEQTKKFIDLITSISIKKMPVMNMSWKAALDMGALFMCSTTSKMIYDKEWLEFCQVMYHMFGGGIMNTLRGRAHFSHVTSSRCRKGFFKPVEGEFNFPIPSLPTLKKLDIGYPTQIDVGIIQHSIDLAEERAKQGEEFILSFDGKLISPGCKDKDTGDCNMWGREGPPNLKKSLRILQHSLSAADQIDVDMTNRTLSVHSDYIENLLLTSTQRVKRLRERITGSFYLQKRLIANVGDNKELQYKYRRRMSTLNHNTAECESVVRRLLEINIEITNLLYRLLHVG